MFSRTVFVWAIGLPITFVLFLAVILSFLIDRSGNVVHSIGSNWFKIILALSGVRVDISGVENIPKGTAVIILSNHQGAFDIPVLQAYLPLQFRWVAKKSLFKIPVLGWSMSLAGYIAIEREKASLAYKSIEAAAEKIKKGTSVLIFPEGTRGLTNGLLPFKKGAFLLAAKSGMPIVPVALKGTRDIMKKGSLLISPADVTVRIGRPVDTARYDEKTLSTITREEIARLLG